MTHEPAKKKFKFKFTSCSETLRVTGDGYAYAQDIDAASVAAKQGCEETLGQPAVITQIREVKA